MAIRAVIRHWLPLVTLCPVNRLPDLIYVSVEVRGMVELYEVRRAIKASVRSKRLRFMEDVALGVLEDVSEAEAVQVRLLFNRHEVRVTRD